MTLLEVIKKPLSRIKPHFSIIHLTRTPAHHIKFTFGQDKNAIQTLVFVGTFTIGVGASIVFRFSAVIDESVSKSSLAYRHLNSHPRGVVDSTNKRSVDVELSLHSLTERGGPDLEERAKTKAKGAGIAGAVKKIADAAANGGKGKNAAGGKTGAGPKTGAAGTAKNETGRKEAAVYYFPE
jgi:hypothetical protein